jgi:diaminohydroxyphosphoribosylaminopyrimidine deaminase/5-amino-6-(5-phosphoribosylamino)uracil reductase
MHGIQSLQIATFAVRPALRMGRIMTFTPFDRHMMTIALRLAARGLGRTAPNPAVGAVITDEATGEIIARGWTQPGGRPHAETEALRRAGAAARGKTMYVTLEPCSHYGKTPPCADAVIAAGITRLVVAIEDPDPRVAGRGLDRLRAAGVRVERGLLAREAHCVTRGHIVRVTERRPLIQLKMATGLDGEVPRGIGGQPTWVTGPEARAFGHMLRATADAILVGHGTVRDDDPALTCRLPGLADRSPVRIVLASDPRGLAATQLARTAREAPVWVATAANADPAATAPLVAAGVRMFPVPMLAGGLWLPDVMEAIVAEGITRLLVEGGPRVWRAFSRHGLVDEVVLFRPRGPGGAAASDAAAVEALARHVDPGELRLVDRRRLGGDEMLLFRSGIPGVSKASAMSPVVTD